MATKTVAYLTPLYFDEKSYLGGGERFPLNLARGVVHASGGSCRVQLISFGVHPARIELARGIQLRVLPTAGRPAHPMDVVSWDLPEALGEVDLLHIHQAYTRSAELGLLFGRLHRLPICVTDHGGLSSRLGVELGAIDLADRIVAYSNFGASLYQTSRPIHVIKGGVDCDRFEPPVKPVARDRVLYVGRLLPHKGIDNLIQALPRGLKLTVCGRPYHADYHEKLKQMAHGKQVEFVTDADDERIRGLYARSWATILPSVYRDCYGNVYQAPELMGFTLLESMSCGTPAIASRVGAMPEFIDQGRTGFVFETLDELTTYLEYLASNPDRVREMGDEASRVVRARYDLKVAGAQLLEIYRELWQITAQESLAA